MGSVEDTRDSVKGNGDYPVDVEIGSENRTITVQYRDIDVQMSFDGTRLNKIILGGPPQGSAVSATIVPHQKDTTPVLRGQQIHVGETVVPLTEPQACVAEAFANEGGVLIHSDLLKHSGVASAVKVLGNLAKNVPELSPFISLPGGKNKGGYRFTIRKANE